MARILVSAYMVRYPLGGMMSLAFQWLVGLHQLGHDVYLLEKGDYPDACFDPSQDIMTDDCSYGAGVVRTLLERFGLQERWCYVDVGGEYFGLSREQVNQLFVTADLHIDIGNHSAWLPEAAAAGTPSVLLDGEPASTQMRMEMKAAAGQSLPDYDAYYTVGRSIGTALSSAPTAGRTWRPLFYPVVLDLFPVQPSTADAPFTTVMNWQSHTPVEFHGSVYGQKDVEFAKFMRLPELTAAPLEIAVSCRSVPLDQLRQHRWSVRNGHAVTRSFDSFVAYLQRSRGEFSVCKNVFVATQTGWCGDRNGAYLASGRPVVMQDTGFSAHLPCGRGLFAVRTAKKPRPRLPPLARTTSGTPPGRGSLPASTSMP